MSQQLAGEVEDSQAGLRVDDPQPAAVEEHLVQKVARVFHGETRSLEDRLQFATDRHQPELVAVPDGIQIVAAASDDLEGSRRSLDRLESHERPIVRLDRLVAGRRWRRLLCRDELFPAFVVDVSNRRQNLVDVGDKLFAVRVLLAPRGQELLQRIELGVDLLFRFRLRAHRFAPQAAASVELAPGMFRFDQALVVREQFLVAQFVDGDVVQIVAAAKPHLSQTHLGGHGSRDQRRDRPARMMHFRRQPLDVAQSLNQLLPFWTDQCGSADVRHRAGCHAAPHFRLTCWIRSPSDLRRSRRAPHFVERFATAQLRIQPMQPRNVVPEELLFQRVPSGFRVGHVLHGNRQDHRVRPQQTSFDQIHFAIRDHSVDQLQAAASVLEHRGLVNGPQLVRRLRRREPSLAINPFHDLDLSLRMLPLHHARSVKVVGQQSQPIVERIMQQQRRLAQRNRFGERSQSSEVLRSLEQRLPLLVARQCCFCRHRFQNPVRHLARQPSRHLTELEFVSLPRPGFPATRFHGNIERDL